MRRRRARMLDMGIATACAAALIAAAVTRTDQHPAPLGVIVALAAVSCAPLLWRRRRPLAVLGASWAGLIACALLARPYDAATVVALVPLYTVATTGNRRRSLITGAIGALVLAVLSTIIEGTLFTPTAELRGLLALGAVGLGDLVRSRRELAAAAQQRAARERQDREEESRRRVIAERLQIARELHDTLAHALVAINVRAGVAALLAGPGDATDALDEIKVVSADALGDLRATLDVLRDRDAPAPTVPALDLDAVPALLATARAAGVQTESDIELNRAAIPAAVGQAAYRIVQESVTNILRHANASRARVSIRTGAGRLRIEVMDDGPGGTAPSETGHGIQGMLERAGALGGQVWAGPAPERGWRVAAELPLT